MSRLRTLALAATLILTLSACAHYLPGPGGPGHSSHHPPGAAAAAATPAERMAQMDAHMNAMRDMHEKMSRASSPQERQALMGEHQKLMQEGMALMGGMGHGPRAGMPMDQATRQQMMEMTIRRVMEPQAVNYDPLKDLIPLGLTTRSPSILVVRQDAPYNTFQELVAHARKAPGRTRQ